MTDGGAFHYDDATMRLLGDALVSSDSDVRRLRSVDVLGESGRAAWPPRISPATGHGLFSLVPTGTEGVDQVVENTRTALSNQAWSRATGQQRQRWLLEIATALDTHAEQMARLIVLDTGKPIGEARGEVGAAINSFEYFAALARDVRGELTTRASADRWGIKLREPAGVAGLISPWNFPLAVLCQKLPPALAAGCSAVVKPSPLAPMAAVALGQLIAASSLPPGVIGIVLGGTDEGQHLVAHPGVDVVSFTGSSSTGRLVAANAQQRRLKRVAVEGTGNAPLIVTSEASIDEAAAGALHGSSFMQGECCVGTARILVDQRIVDEFIEAFARHASRVVLGDPFDAQTEMGPLISAEHGEQLANLVERSLYTGASIRCGQDRPDTRPDLAGGPWWAPTLVTGVGPTEELVRQETFGPVATVQPFRDIDEALQLANGTPYGLGASVWSHDLRTMRHLVDGLEAGIVWVNGAVDSYPELTLSGRKDSGLGQEYGREGMEFFTEIKTVHLRHTY